MGKVPRTLMYYFATTYESNYFKREVKGRQNTTTTTNNNHLPKPKPINVIVYIQIIFTPTRACELAPLYVFLGHLELVLRAQPSFPTQTAQAPVQSLHISSVTKKSMSKCI